MGRNLPQTWALSVILPSSTQWVTKDVYGHALKHLKDARPRILEIGIGINDPSVAYGMDPGHIPGSSLIGWSNYFPGSEVMTLISMQELS